MGTTEGSSPGATNNSASFEKTHEKCFERFIQQF